MAEKAKEENKEEEEKSQYEQLTSTQKCAILMMLLGEEEASEILDEYYLSCLIDRKTSKIAFISSKEGGMNIEEVASKNPEKIITTKVELSKEIRSIDIEKIAESIFNKTTSVKTI